MRITTAMLIGLALWGAPAFACENDQETGKAEKEFRSQYKRSLPAPAPEPSSEEEYRPAVLGGTGTALIAGSLALILVRRKRGA